MREVSNATHSAANYLVRTIWVFLKEPIAVGYWFIPLLFPVGTLQAPRIRPRGSISVSPRIRVPDSLRPSSRSQFECGGVEGVLILLQV